MDKLAEIITWKRKEIEPLIRTITDDELAELKPAVLQRPSFLEALSNPKHLSVIAEIKRKSPSAGAIATGADSKIQAGLYAKAGADALSILTDEKYFGGHLSDLKNVTDQFADQNILTPCLRKEFMLHPVQVVEAALAGASAILIIVRALSDEEIKKLHEAASLAGLSSLFEIYNENDLERTLSADAKLIGINNRDLTVFKTDLAISERLIPQIPSGITTISASGIFTKEDAARVRAVGADAILVGEALMRAPSPFNLIQDFHSI
jgi:indole-3-glycerol phosphate synthase